MITVSMLEVYNENIRDLLTDNGGDTKLEVKMGEYGNHVPGQVPPCCSLIYIHTYKACFPTCYRVSTVNV